MKRIIVLILIFCIGVAKVHSSVSLVTKNISIYPEKETGKIVRIVFNTDTRGGVLFLIKYEKGKIIKSLSTGKIEPGQHYVDWDGRDYVGNIVPEGKYNVSIITGISMKID